MKEKRIVVALGRNAFGETFPEQKKNVKKAAQAIADLVEQKYQIVITHSNGPQVGMIQTAMTEFARLDNDKNYTVAPMSLCGAMSEGYIGYDLQNAIRTELLDRGIFKPVSTIITQVRPEYIPVTFDMETQMVAESPNLYIANLPKEQQESKDFVRCICLDKETTSLSDDGKRLLAYLKRSDMSEITELDQNGKELRK